MTGLLVASYGWDHDAWEGSLYPEDLPRDWRLPYYANEFRAVLVPFAYWQAAPGEAASRWAEDTDASFRFFLDLPPGAAGYPDLSGLLCLGERLGGFVSEAAGASLMHLQPPERRREAGAAPGGPARTHAGLCVPLARLLSGRPGERAGGRLAVSRLIGEPSPRELRDRITGFLARARGCEHALLVVHGAPPDLVLLRQAKAVAELLGY